MARDPMSIHAIVTLTCAGAKAGHVSNTLNFKFIGSGAPTFTDWTNLETAIKNFYNTAATGGGKLTSYLGAQFNRATNLSEIALYQIDFADPRHYLGSPVHVVPWTLGAGGSSTPVPNECAAVLSYRAGYGTDPEHNGSQRPRADDRGRFYAGPLDFGALSTVTLPDGTQYSTLASNIVTTLKLSAQAMFDALAAQQWAWSVWSRKEGLLKQVQYVACDTDIDSQRRRGVRDALQSWTVLT